MDLVGLSFKPLYKCLSHKKTGSKANLGAAPEHGPAPDGRRAFGSVRDAVIHVLTVEPLGLRARDVHARVELLLGERVSRSSVKSMLALRCQGDNKLFTRIGRGYYRLHS